MRNNPVVMDAFLEMAGKELKVLLSNGKTLGGVLRRAEAGTLVLTREIKLEPTPKEIEEALTQDSKAEIQIGVVRTKIVLSLDDVVAVEGETFSNLRPATGDKLGPDNSSPQPPEAGGPEVRPDPGNNPV